MFRKFILENKLIEKNDKILIAFSAGPDSVFLLEKLLEIKEEFNLKIHLGYVNHNFRDDVWKDIELVEKIAQKYHLEFTILNIKLDIFSEERARELRYKVLGELKDKLSFDKIATGHNKTDNAETIIFRLIRGTGLDGLEGIKVRREDIIRPILYISKQDILKQVYNEYIVDKTNLENNYSRNKIRNLIFPIFEEINSKFIDNIVKIHQNIINNNDQKYEFIINKLKEYNISLNTKKINQIYSILEKNESKIIDLGNGFVWYKSYETNSIIKQSDLFKNEDELILSIDKELVLNGYTIGYTNSTGLEKILNKGYNIVTLDTFKKDSIFNIRTRLDGDKLGNKKLKKLFIDSKVDKLERDKIPLVIFEDNIIMVGNLFKLKTNTTLNEYYVYIRRNDGK